MIYIINITNTIHIYYNYMVNWYCLPNCNGSHALFLVAATGNYTEWEEQAEEEIETLDAAVNEYPLQKDDVEVTSRKTERKMVGASTTGSTTNEDSKQYVGFVIGVLTVVILVLMAAIVFIVYRNQKLKERRENSASGLHSDLRFEGILKVIWGISIPSFVIYFT